MCCCIPYSPAIDDTVLVNHGGGFNICVDICHVSKALAIGNGISIRDISVRCRMVPSQVFGAVAMVYKVVYAITVSAKSTYNHVGKIRGKIAQVSICQVGISVGIVNSG